MQILINTDQHINANSESMATWQSDIASALDRFAEWITRIDVHLTDENSAAKGGDDDIRCLMEARPRNHQPVSIEVRSGTPYQAVSEATDTLEKRLATMLDKARTQSRKPNRD